ncbi:MAG: trypsin-like peptidase domain-containing protein [Propionibacteriaceae bacterium]
MSVRARARTRRLRRQWRRVAGVGIVTTLLSVSALSAGAVVRTDVSAGPVVLTDWSDGYGPYGSDGSRYGQGQQQDPWSGSDSTSTQADSQAATKAESKGVAIIDTVLGYQDAAAAGTGIVLTSDGEVLTNYHVVEGSTSIKVTIASTGKTYSATVIGHDQTDDVALLKLAGASQLTTAKIDDDTLKTGDSVTAVGNAGGTSSLSAADGTVTSLGQTITTASESSTEGETLQGLIMTDADVVAGDSGGPLIDTEGEVVGIDTAASTGAEINGYAIPIDDALAIVKQILSGDETSTVQIGQDAFLGVELESTASASQSYSPWDTAQSTDETSGATIAGVVADGPAADVGLDAGDVITSVGQTSIDSAESLSAALAKLDVGDKVKLGWTDSAGSSHTSTVKLAASPEA